MYDRPHASTGIIVLTLFSQNMYKLPDQTIAQEYYRISTNALVVFTTELRIKRCLVRLIYSMSLLIGVEISNYKMAVTTLF